MPDYRRQHFLPATYLRHFSIDGRSSTRMSKIWRLDSSGRRPVTVETQGSQKYFYSRDQAPEVEKQFQFGEDFYTAIGPNIWTKGGIADPHVEFGLLLTILDLHIRNLAYAKRPTDNFQEYLNMSATSKHRILWGRSRPPTSEQAVVDEATKNWRVRILGATTGMFLTSDNPSIMANMGHSRSHSLANLLLLPLTPLTYGVAIDSRALQFTAEEMSEEDEAIVTHLQIRQCLQAVFASECFTDQQCDGFKMQFGQRKLRAGVEGPGKWGAEIFAIPSPTEFSFIRPPR